MAVVATVARTGAEEAATVHQRGGRAVSAEVVASISIRQIDDLPTAQAAKYYMAEDGGWMNVTLGFADAETTNPLDLFIATLPSKGKLYLPEMVVATASGGVALAPNATHISKVRAALVLDERGQDRWKQGGVLLWRVGMGRGGERASATGRGRPVSDARCSGQAYNVYGSAGTPIEQHASRVISVSSFWGGPPGSSYHPIHILGPPDCSTAGECATDHPWTTNASMATLVELSILLFAS